jgi:hypothetical protein
MTVDVWPLPWRPTTVFTGRSKYKVGGRFGGEGGMPRTGHPPAPHHAGRRATGGAGALIPPPPTPRPPTPSLQVDTASGLITSHVDTWDAVADNSFLSLEAIAHLMRQVRCLVLVSLRAQRIVSLC